MRELYVAAAGASCNISLYEFIVRVYSTDISSIHRLDVMLVASIFTNCRMAFFV